MKDESPSPPISGLIGEPEISKELYRRRSRYIFETVPNDKERIQKSQDDGWEIQKRNKKSVRLKKLKAYDVALEDRVWTLLAKLGWEWMNKDRTFRLDYAKTKQGKQIDVFAADSETVLIVECKSTKSWKPGTFRDEILEVQGLKKGVNGTIRQAFSTTPKTAWLFVTQNYRISDDTLKHFTTNNIHHISEGELSYYEQLVDHLGPVAKYQLFGRLFSGMEIPELDTRFPALRGKAGGHVIYCFLVEPELLLKVGYVLHRTSELELEDVQSYQRLVSKARMKDIKKFLDEGGYFANSILLNIRSNRRGGLHFDLAGGGDHASNTDIGIVHLPKTYQSAMIIDGQHRLFGYGHTERRKTDMLPVVAFCNLPGEEQQELFVDINAKQKPVPKNLLMTLMAAFDFDSDMPSIAKPAAVTRLIEVMNSDKGSYLYKRIVLAEEKRTAAVSVTLRYLQGEGLNKTSILASVDNGKLIEGHCWTKNWSGTVRKAYKFLNLCMSTIYEVEELKTQWDRGSGPGGFVAMNASLSALFIAIDEVLAHLVKTKGVRPSTLSPEELHKKVRPHLDDVALFLMSLDDSSIERLRSFGGGGAVKRILRHYQYAIYKSDNTFTPEGLLQWNKESTLVYTDKTEPLTTAINIALKDYCWKKMQDVHGRRRWLDYIPMDIKTHIEKEFRNRGRKEPQENYLNLIHYKDIILDNAGDVFDIGVFTSPEQKGKSIRAKKKLDWFFQISDARSKCTHPEREIVTEEAYNFVREVYDWLLPRLRADIGKS